MTDRRTNYILSQVGSVAEVYGERYGRSLHLDNKLRFVMIPEFRLPKRWGLRASSILIWFPKNYPDTPPNGFYLSKNCKGPHIYSRNVFGDSPDLSDQGWNWYCVHMNDGWRPSSDPNQADNLWTILDVIRMSLSVAEF